MIKESFKIKKIISFFIAFIFLLSILPHTCVAQSFFDEDDISEPDFESLELGELEGGEGKSNLGGLEKSAGKAGYSNIGDYQNNIPVIIALIIRALLTLVGVIFVSLIIYGGYLWMTARGNEQRVEKAKETLKAAIIGLVIIFSAYAITYFIGTQLQDAGTPPAEEGT